MSPLLFPCYDDVATTHMDLGDERRTDRLEPDALVVLPFLD